MEIKRIFTEYFLGGSVLLFSFIQILDIISNKFIILSLSTTVSSNMIDSFTLILSVFFVALCCAIGAGMNSFAIFIFSFLETGIRIKTIEKFYNLDNYKELDIFKDYKTCKFEQRKQICRNIFSSLRIYLCVNSSELEKIINFHRNELRMTRSLLIPIFLLSLSTPLWLVKILGFPLISAYFMLVFTLLIFLGLLSAYRNRLYWMQEMTIRAYYLIKNNAVQ